MSKKFKVTLDMRKLNEIDKNLEKTNTKLLENIGEETLKDSNRNIPVDTSELRDSGFVKVKGNEVMVGYTAPYALRQHEDLTLQHDDGEPKFLESALKRNVKKNVSLIKDAIRRLCD